MAKLITRFQCQRNVSMHSQWTLPSGFYFESFAGWLGYSRWTNSRWKDDRGGPNSKTSGPRTKNMQVEEPKDRYSGREVYKFDKQQNLSDYNGLCSRYDGLFTIPSRSSPANWADNHCELSPRLLKGTCSWMNPKQGRGAFRETRTWEQRNTRNWEKDK